MDVLRPATPRTLSRIGDFDSRGLPRLTYRQPLVWNNSSHCIFTELEMVQGLTFL